MTDLERQLTDHLHRRAAAAIPRYDLEGIEHAENRDIVASPVPIDARDRRGRPRWLVAVAAVTVLVALAAAVALRDDGQTVDTTPVTEPTTIPAPPTTLSLADLEDGRQFRVANVTVTIQCTATKSLPDSDMRDLVLGGVVTDNPDDRATLDGVSVAEGDLLALIIRDTPDGYGRPYRRWTLYDNTQWYGGATITACDELVESVPTWVDGGFFSDDLPGGYEILPGG